MTAVPSPPDVTAPAAPGSAVPALLGAWLIAALVVGASGVLARSPLPPPVLALVLGGALTLALRGVPSLRAWAARVDLRVLVAFHLVRGVAGGYFLLLAAQGRLPAAFAGLAGWGDLAVAVLALPVLLVLGARPTPGSRALLLVWNLLGLFDILLVLGSAARLALAGGAGAAALTGFQRLPLAILPIFIVPLVLATHAVIFARLLARAR